MSPISRRRSPSTACYRRSSGFVLLELLVLLTLFGTACSVGESTARTLSTESPPRLDELCPRRGATGTTRDEAGDLTYYCREPRSLIGERLGPTSYRGSYDFLLRPPLATEREDGREVCRVRLETDGEFEDFVAVPMSFSDDLGELWSSRDRDEQKRAIIRDFRRSFEQYRRYCKGRLDVHSTYDALFKMAMERKESKAFGHFEIAWLGTAGAVVYLDGYVYDDDRGSEDPMLRFVEQLANDTFDACCNEVRLPYLNMAEFDPKMHCGWFSRRPGAVPPAAPPLAHQTWNRYRSPDGLAPGRYIYTVRKQRDSEYEASDVCPRADPCRGTWAERRRRSWSYRPPRR